MAFRGRPVFLVVSGLHFYIFSSCQSLMTVKKCQAELPLVIMSARYTALNLAHNVGSYTQRRSSMAIGSGRFPVKPIIPIAIGTERKDTHRIPLLPNLPGS